MRYRFRNNASPRFGSLSSFDYNHNNERTFRRGSNLDRQYAYDESSHLIGEYTGNGALIVEYVWLGDRPIAAVYPSNRIVYIVTDNQSKPRRGIDATTQQVVWSWDADAFGVLQPATGLTNGIEMNLRFPGQYYDVQSGLYYNHNRYYNPELGRYMEVDPLGLKAGLNPYAYVGSSPTNAVDPSGLIVYGMEKPIGRGMSSPLDGGRLQNSLTWFAGHKFIYAVPDNLADVQKLTGRDDLGSSFTIGAYNNRGVLSAAFDGDNALTARSSSVINPPSSYSGNSKYSADTLFIAALVNNTQNYINRQETGRGIPYNATSGEAFNLLRGAVGGLNSNSWQGGLLNSLGVTQPIDPWGWQPGQDSPVPASNFSPTLNIQFDIINALGW